MRMTEQEAREECQQLVLTALHQAGGVDYLKQQAQAFPEEFMTLVGAVFGRGATPNNSGIDR